MKALLRDMIRAIVDDEEGVEVSVVEGSTSSIYEVRVAPDDLGKIIGRNGRMAMALRTFVRGMGRKNGSSYLFQVIEERHYG